MAMLVHDDLGYHEYEGLALDADERPRLQADLGQHGAMLLWNHGTLTCGATVGEAFRTPVSRAGVQHPSVRMMTGPSCTKDLGRRRQEGRGADRDP